MYWESNPAVHFCVIHVDLFFKKTFRITPKQKCTQKNQIRRVQYYVADVCALDNTVLARIINKLVRIHQFPKKVSKINNRVLDLRV